MQLSFVAIALALAATVSALPADPLAARQSCLADNKTVDRFFVAYPGNDDEDRTCYKFREACNSLDGNSAGVRIYNAQCEVSERYIIRAECVGGYQGDKVSYTRNVARELGLGLSVDSNGRCNEIVRGKCSKKDFNGEARIICGY